MSDLPNPTLPEEIVGRKYSYTELRDSMRRVGFDVVKRALQSSNFVSGSAGWRITAEGDLEASSGTFRGTITATTGTIGGFSIGSDYLRDAANSFGLASTVSASDDVRFWAGDTFANRATAPFRITEAGVLTMTQSIGSVRLDTTGLTWLVSTTENANIRLSSGTSPMSGATLTIGVGGIAGNALELELIWSSNNTGKLRPAASDTVDLGDSSQYFNEINYKTLTDRGCLGWFDEGVELQDGSIVSDMEAIMAIEKDPEKTTVYGKPMLKYSSMPKVVFKPAPIAEKNIYELDLNGKATKKIRFRKGEPIGQDGAETTALISIMIGGMKELYRDVQKMKKEDIKK